MKEKTKAVAGIAMIVTAVALTIQDTRKIRRQERENRTKIANEAARNLAAEIVAAERVIERIEEGKYDDGGFEAAMNDFKFERIIARVTMED